MLGLRCCAQAFSSCGERGLFFDAVLGLLIAVASPVTEHGLQAHGPQQSRHVGPAVAALGLQSTGSAAPRHVGSSRTRDKTRVPCIGRQTPNHCATRDAPKVFFLIVLCHRFKWSAWIQVLVKGNISEKYFWFFENKLLYNSHMSVFILAQINLALTI